RVYKAGEPRAAILRGMAEQACRESGQFQWYQIAVKLHERIGGAKGLIPNVDFYSAPLFYSLGIPVDLFTPVIAAGRIAGWSANIIEQHDDNRLIRPRAEYVAPGRRARVVTYIDHQVFQVDSRNSDDHRYMQTASRKYGAVFSKPGNGICHQVHMETYSIPGQMVLGSDSHTPLCGAAGMLAIGAGGLDVAVAMGGGPYFLTMPTVVRVWLTGQLQPWVTAKDVILELLRRYSVRGGSGKIFEYAGPGVKSLLAAQRTTIANMGAELGLTT